jgi:hypothetical protein
MDGWKHFCYVPVTAAGSSPDISPSSSFQWWIGGDFEMCFQYLAFVTSSAALFGAVSFFYAGRYRSRYRRDRRPLVVMLKLGIAVCMALNSLVGFVAAFWMDRQRPYAVLVTQLVSFVSWSIHAAALWVFSTSLGYTDRGPLVLNASWYLTLVASILHFRSTVRWTLNSTPYQYTEPPDMYFSLLSRVSIYIHMGLQVLYGMSLLFPAPVTTSKRVTGGGRGRLRVKETAVSIQSGETSEDEEEEEEEVREEQPLMYRGHGSTYGTLYSARDNVDSELLNMNAYEDRANPVSLLFFLWVWPLLRRGAMGGLESTTDLPPLPKTLRTSLICEKFRRVLERRGSAASASNNMDVKVGVSAQQGTEGWSTGAASFLDSEVAMRSIARTTPLPSTTPPLTSTDSSTYTGPGPSVDGANSRKMGSQTDGRAARQSTSLLFLFSAFNRAFGWHYYPLGLIKFTTDLLGFSGPLLLYQLVSFIENKQEPMYYGYLFALGLLCSTLVTAILTSHFNYQVNKVGLKVRAALITEVYRKSLSISLSTMSRYSTGQVVNFMSTDTDRIVNFCQSFHQFWSLPFQIVISLYLLYQQVGLAFLAGVAFCILLIPVNRWLAVKIGQLSTRMMAEKDNRVKACLPVHDRSFKM